MNTHFAEILPLDRELGRIIVHRMTSGRLHACGMGLEADNIEELVRLCDARWTAPEEPDDDGREYRLLTDYACGYSD